MTKSLEERYKELEEAQYQIQDLIMDMEVINLPEGYTPSHHAEMEWSGILYEIEQEMTELRGRIDG